MVDHVLEVLKSCSLLSGLPEAALREVAPLARVRPFRANEVLYQRGEVQSALSAHEAYVSEEVLAGDLKVAALAAAPAEATALDLEGFAVSIALTTI